MDSNAAALNTIILWSMLVSLTLLFVILGYIWFIRTKPEKEKEWEFIIKGTCYKISPTRIIGGSLYTTILFTDGRTCTVVDILPADLPVPGTYIEVSKTKKGNNFKIETPIPPSSCL